MNDLQEIIANTSIKAFNEGVIRERDSILEFLDKTKQSTTCSCENCKSWISAFDWLMLQIASGKNAKSL